MTPADSSAPDSAARLSALRPELHRYCARMMSSVIEGEDVVQDAYLRALSALPSLSPDIPLKPWLFRIAHNRALDLLRSRHVRRAEPMDAAHDVADDAPDPSEALAARDAVRLAVARFGQMPVMQRAVVILKDVLGESLAYTATLLGLSTNAVKAHLARGRARLQRLAASPAPQAGGAVSAELTRYIALFNARDWDALRDLLAADARLQQSHYPLRSGPTVREFFGIYATYGDVRLAPGWVDGREVIAVFEAGAPEPHHMMRLDWREDRIAFIHDYRYVAYVLSEAALVPAQAR